MQQAEFNHNDFNATSDADKTLLVKFFYKERPDEAKTLEEGRPVFKEVEYISIRVAGQRDVQACRPATLVDKQRFEPNYEAFKKRVEPPMEGMPLTEWPQIARSQIEQLSYLGVKTVEQLINVSDTNMSQLMGGQSLKRKAKDWLELAGAETVIAERDELKAQVAKMQEQIAKLLEKPKDVPAAEPVVETPKAAPKEVAKNSRRRRGK